MRKRYLTTSAMGFAVLVLDQITKVIARSEFVSGEVRPVIDGFFNLVLVMNRGAAFGFLNRADSSWQTWVFAAAALGACVAILAIVRSSDERDRLLHATLGLLLGGAVGNLVDRVLFGEVTDFLDFYVGDWHWPAFNVADIAICVGAGLLALTLFKDNRHASDAS